MSKQSKHLELAREDLAIAESADAKYEAYKRATEHIAAHIEETGDTNRKVCIAIQISEAKFYKLMAWREAGYPEGTTPFTMASPSGSSPTERAALSHARRVARENPEAIAEAIKEAPAEAREAAFKVLAADREIEDELVHVVSDAIDTRRLEAGNKPKQPRPSTTWHSIVDEIGRATRGIERGLREFADQPEPPDEIKAGLIAHADRLTASADLLRAYCSREQGGEPTGIIEDIEAFLASHDE